VDKILSDAEKNKNKVIVVMILQQVKKMLFASQATVKV
jgi:hypothetical protein